MEIANNRTQIDAIDSQSQSYLSCPDNSQISLAYHNMSSDVRNNIENLRSVRNSCSLSIDCQKKVERVVQGLTLVLTSLGVARPEDCSALNARYTNDAKNAQYWQDEMANAIKTCECRVERKRHWFVRGNLH